MNVIRNFLTMATLTIVCISVIDATPVFADTKKSFKTAKVKTYQEMEFIRTFSGKTRQQVSNILGAPDRREQSVKPTNVDYVIGQPAANTSPTNIEMWYYNGVVEYAKKKTYKTTELTFVNDHCANVAFFNARQCRHEIC